MSLLFKAHHGRRTAQFRNTAANTSNVKSVTITLPLWKKSPPMAGNKASASGTECQCDDSVSVVTTGLLALGRSKSSVEDLRDSDKFELRRCLKGREGSANVNARPRGR